MISAEDMAKYRATFSPGDEPDEEDARRPNPFPYSESEDVVLPEDYTPTKHDVINGRGRKSYNHIANRRFRQLIAMNLTRYLAARCKVDKTLVVVGIVNTIRNAEPTGGFLKKCPKRGRWISMSDESAREKVGHCLRDMIASQRGKETKKGDKGKGGGATATSKKNSSKASSAAAKLEVAPPPLTAAMAHADATSKPPVLNPWLAAAAASASAGAGLSPALSSLHHPLNNPIRGDAPFASMWSAVKNEIPATTVSASSSSKARNKQQQRQPPDFPQPSGMPPLTAPSLASNSSLGDGAAMDLPPAALPLGLNNLDAITLQKGNLQDMSEQQRKILVKLEGGFKGSVEELMEAVK